MTRNDWIPVIRLSIALCGAVLMAIPSVSADTNQQRSPQSPRQFRPPSADKDFACEHLKAPVDIPGVPPFTGRTKFIAGLRYPSDPTGYRLGLTFAAMEEPTQILDWYKAALAGYGWKVVNNATQTPNVLTATRSGSTFTLSITDNKMPGYRTVMTLSFKAHAGR